ncbi:MAG: histidine kinase [Clostridiaceae bacterium]|nr:histidine kinase [Clostridiaceae bacterium]
MVRKFKFVNSIFSRLIIMFLIIMVPMYILAIYIYKWGSNTVKDQILNSIIAQTSYYIERLEKEVERIKILQYDCLNDENLNKLAIRWEIMDQYDINESMRQLQQRLFSIKSSSIYIKNVSVHIFPLDKTISSNTGVDPISYEGFKDMRVPVNMKGAQIIDNEGTLFLSTFQENSYINSNPLFIIDIELNREAFEKELNQFNTYKDSSSFLINLTNNDIIMSQSDSGNRIFTEDIVVSLNKEKSYGTMYSKIGDEGYYIVYSKSDYLSMVIIRYIPEEYILKPLEKFYIWLQVFFAVTIFIIIVYSLSIYKLMHKPLSKLVESFHKVENGDLNVSISHDSKYEFGYLYKRFNNMVKKLNTLINQVYNQKILMQRAELKQLQLQINPHFLYNSFFILNTMVRTGDENLLQFTKNLGEYFRFITRNSSDFIRLIDEINHAKVYAEIQLIRFSRRLQILFGECPEKYHSLKVPRLILQPIIENAFEHGIEKKKNGAVISVNFKDWGERLDIIIEDNGNGMTDKSLAELRRALEYDGQDCEITAMINIHRRIRLTYGEKSGLFVDRSDLGGLKVVLRIKTKKEENDVPLANCG